MNLYLDLETYSTVPITHGTHAYAEGAEIMLFAWAIDDEPVAVWDCTKDPMPKSLYDALTTHTLCAHNSQFDRTVLHGVFGSGKECRLGRPRGFDFYPAWVNRIVNPASWRDTMVKALAHSLPGSLGALCDVLRIPTDQAKDKAGKQLINLFCKPRPKGSRIERATRETHPAEWAQFVHYAGLDIEAMRAIDKRLPDWNYQGEELALWHLDQVINDRGVAMDAELALSAIAAVDRRQKELARRTVELTDGAVQAATQRDAMLKHLAETYGVELPDMQSATLERRVNDTELPHAFRELLAIRLQASSTSVSKYKTLVNGVSKDGRLRGTLQFDGASRTGRWAGRLFQPQNLPRPSLKQDVIDEGIGAIKADCADLLGYDIMALTASALRGCIVSAPGKKLVVADLSNIEGRVLAWLAGEDWKLQAFRDYDTIVGQDQDGEPLRKGHDLYKLAYARAFNISPDQVDKHMRQIGKVMELGLGYEGGVGAFLTFAAVYGLDIEAMAEAALPVIPAGIVAESTSALEWTRKNRRPTFGLSDRAWIACDSLKRMWRYAHPRVSSLWKELGEAVRTAIGRTGTGIPCRSLVVRRDGAWLRIRLPSGRFLCYPSPRISEDGKITFMGVSPYSRKWSRQSTYGGKLVENVTQATARDVLAANMPAIERKGYAIVLSVHDELLTEADDTNAYSADELVSLMSTVPTWAAGLPLSAAGFEAHRYKKD